MFLLKEADNDPTGESALQTHQMLTYYELDLGLNHVVRKYSEQLEEHANSLIAGKMKYLFKLQLFKNMSNRYEIL